MRLAFIVSCVSAGSRWRRRSMLPRRSMTSRRPSHYGVFLFLFHSTFPLPLIHFDVAGTVDVKPRPLLRFAFLHNPVPSTSDRLRAERGNRPFHLRCLAKGTTCALFLRSGGKTLRRVDSPANECMSSIDVRWSPAGRRTGSSGACPEAATGKFSDRECQRGQLSGFDEVSRLLTPFYLLQIG